MTTPEVEVTVEFDYCYIDTDQWFKAVARDVSEKWRAIVERIKDECPLKHEHYDFSSSKYRCARDRIIAALVQRVRDNGDAWEHETFSGHTINQDTNFCNEFAYEVVPYYVGKDFRNYLIFVSKGDYHDTGLDAVFEVDSIEEAYNSLSPRIGYSCTHGVPDADPEYAETTNGGATFEDGNGGERRDVIEDGKARCSLSHEVTLYAQIDF